jgi:hypothetical protein
VPLVHYADKRLLADGHRGRQSAESASISSLEERPLTARRKGSPNASTINLEPMVDMAAGTSSSGGSATIDVILPPTTGNLLVGGKDLVDVDVQVSAGDGASKGRCYDGGTMCLLRGSLSVCIPSRSGGGTGLSIPSFSRRLA